MPENNNIISIDNLPKSTLQYLYNAVTGKTESMSKSLYGNVEIRKDDVASLYDRIIQRIEHYETVTNPTVTIVIKYSNDKSVTYSSWARFCSINTDEDQITSEISIKIEFLIKLPKTDGPQRCIISISLDSSLPLLIERTTRIEGMDDFGFFIMLSPRWKAADVKIDFVDFLIAKTFCDTIEEWFGTLCKMKTSKLSRITMKYSMLISTLFAKAGRVGFATFVLIFVFYSTNLTLEGVTKCASFGILLWALTDIFCTILHPTMMRRTMTTLIPTVIRATKKDDEEYSKIISSKKHPIVTTAIMIGSILLTILINIFSSYLYAKYIEWN